MNYLFKKIFTYSILTLAFVSLGIFIRSKINNSTETKVIRTRILMGTLAEIKIWDENKELAGKSINFAFKEIKRIEKIFSTYDNMGEIYRINSSNKKEIYINEELKNLIVVCDSIWKLTNGAFDPTLGTLTKIWGFYGDSPKVPLKQKMEIALHLSGWKNLNIVSDKLIKKRNILLDFGSIAKGYAVDKAVKKLKESGIKKGIVNLGGEVKVFGGSYTIGLKHPRVNNLLLEKVKLNDMGIATSGDYERYFFEKGKRYCHIFDPFSGYPSDKCQSVSIISENVTIADALSTAVFVLGPEKGVRLINKLKDTECFIIDKNGKRFESVGFKNYMTEN